MSAPKDWGEASEPFDALTAFVAGRDLTSENEAQTRYDVIDRFVREVFGWSHGSVKVEEHQGTGGAGFVDYILRLGDNVLVIEAKRYGAAFPSPTRKRRLKITGSVLGTGEIAEAIAQADRYANAKSAQVVVVTNGACWCLYAAGDRTADDHATLLFPFLNPTDAEQLFQICSVPSVQAGSLQRVTNAPPRSEDRLLSLLNDADGRVDRNNIADHIIPALNAAMYSEALLSDAATLKRCFVPTEARSKFSSQLGMYLADPKPALVQPARRIRTGRQNSPLKSVVDHAISIAAPPVTLIIGPVGAGKSTYLKHFELVSGAEVLKRRKIHWIYIDFERMGKEGHPREFIYRALREYLLVPHAGNPTDYVHVIEPAYREELAALVAGPLAPLKNDSAATSRMVGEHIKKEFDAVEPYVDKVFKYLATQGVCVLVLDNIDLYEDDALETTVFSEGLALSKRVLANVIISVRDKTFVTHRNDSVFNAYELRKLWLDPPPFKTVLSTRLTYSKKSIEGRSARIRMANGMTFNVPNLSVFFDIVQRSILRGGAGDYIDSVADLNIRKGLTLVTNFLTSGHIQADRAIRNYLDGNTGYFFPFHEVFKGTMLGQWRHYKELRAECLNLFDSRLGSRKLRLLRLFMINHLLRRAQHEHTVDVSVQECIRLFSDCGASEDQVLLVLKVLADNALVRSTTAENLAPSSAVNVTRAGGYFARSLSSRFVYAEECMMDTAIEDESVWQMLSDLTHQVSSQHHPARRMELRLERIRVFLDYLCTSEAAALNEVAAVAHVACMQGIRSRVLADADVALTAAKRQRHPHHNGRRSGRDRRN